MKSLVTALIVGALLVAGVVVAVGSYNDLKAKSDYDAGRAKLHAEFVERTGFIRSLADDVRYRDEVSAATKWYAAELSALYNRFPGTKAPEAAWEEMVKKEEDGLIKTEDLALRKEFYEETKKAFALFQSGTYNPLATAVSSGIRFDIVRLQRAVDQGKSRLRLDFAVWGAPRREEQIKGNDGKVSSLRIKLDYELKGLSLEFIDDTKPADPKAAKTAAAKPAKAGAEAEPIPGTLLGGGDAGPPELFVIHPERWNADFPPQFAVGHWWFDPLPRDATSMTLAIDGEARSPTRGALPVSYEWKLPVKDEWRLREGEVFEGEERVMPEEDMKR